MKKRTYPTRISSFGRTENRISITYDIFSANPIDEDSFGMEAGSVLRR